MSYYCIVNLPGVPAREISAVQADGDRGARVAMTALAAAWPGFETVTLYHDERVVSVLANPSLGFAADVRGLDQAA